MIRTTLFRALAALAAGTGLVAAAGLSGSQPDPLAPPTNGPRKADPTWHALCNATVHVKPGTVLEHATVVVREGRIVSVAGSPAAVPDAKADAKTDEKAAAKKDDLSMAPAAPAGARVWDCTGLHLYPGFIDPYVEVDAPAPDANAPGQHWNPRVTPQRSAMDGRGIDAGTAESLRKLGYTAAAISPRGGIFRGSAALVSLAKPEDDRSLARPPVYSERVYQTVAIETGGRGGGGDSSNANSNWPGYPNSQMGAIALVRQTLSDADWQAGARAAGAYNEPENCLDALRPTGPRAAGASRAGGYLFNTDDELETFRVAKIAAEFQRPLMVLGCGSEFRRLEGIVELATQSGGEIPFIIPLNFPDAPKVASIGQADAVDLRELMTWEQAPTNPRRLEQAGVHVSLTTSKIRGDRGKFRDNLRKAISYGLTEDEALAMVTTRPAELLGVGGMMGTIEEGKVANLFLADGAVFAKKTQVRDVWVDGVRHEINAAPSSLKGEWELTLDPVPPVPEGATVRRTYSIDKDNNITIRKYTTDAKGEEKVDKVNARSVKVESSGYGVGMAPTRVSFVYDHDVFGKPGVFFSAGVVDGDMIVGDGTRADGGRFRWSAKRIGDEPVADAPGAGEKGLAGTWNLIEDDGVAVDQDLIAQGAAPVLVIEADNSMVVKLHGESIKPETVKVEGKTATITMKGEPFGWEGMVTSVGTVDGDVFAGTTTFADGTTRAWKFKRQATAKGERKPEGEKKEEKTGDPVSGSWAGTATSAQMPQALPFTMDLKMGEGGGVTGSVTSHMGTLEIEDAAFTKKGEGAGALTFGVSPPESERIAFRVEVSNGAMTGSGRGGPMEFALTATRASTGTAAGGGDDDEAMPKDIPETYGYPFGAYALDGVPEQPAYVEIRGATIWTSGPQGVIENGTLIIKNGKIDYVGRAFTGMRPTGAVEIDLPRQEGRVWHITPGLIDCHSHTGISRGVNESGQAVTAEVRIQDVTDPDAMSWYWQLAGGITAVNNLHGSANPIGGQNCVNKNRWGAVHPDDLHFAGAIPGIKFALGENVKQSNWTNSGTRYPQTRMGVETLIRDRFTAAREYLEATKRRGDGATKGGGVRRDLELEALGEILEGKRLIHCHSYRQDEILMLCRVADDFGFKLGTFQHILEGYKVADEVRDHSIGASAFSDWWAYKVEVQDAIPYDGAIMHDVGVTVSFNSDSDELARRMNVEAGKAVKYGNLAPEEALKFVTINPARQLMIDTQVGSLEVGKDADFAVWSVPAAAARTAAPVATGTGAVGGGAKATHHTVDGTPMSTMARCEQTWVDGRCYFSTQIDATLRERNVAERNRIIQKLVASGPKKGGSGVEGARPGGPPAGGPPGGRRRRPTDDGLTSGAGVMDDGTPIPARLSLLQSMLEQGEERRREYYLQLWRMGIDPAYSRCGDCGESMGGMEGSR